MWSVRPPPVGPYPKFPHRGPRLGNCPKTSTSGEFDSSNQDEDHSRSSYRLRLRRHRQRRRVAGQSVRGTDVSYHATALHFSGEKPGKRAEDFITAEKCRLHPCGTKPELAFRRWLQNKGKPVLERMYVWSFQRIISPAFNSDSVVCRLQGLDSFKPSLGPGFPLLQSYLATT